MKLSNCHFPALTGLKTIYPGIWHPEVEEMLEQYYSSFGYHQNRYQGNPREAMRWPVSYGEYEW